MRNIILYFTICFLILTVIVFENELYIEASVGSDVIPSDILAEALSEAVICDEMNVVVTDVNQKALKIAEAKILKEKAEAEAAKAEAEAAALSTQANAISEADYNSLLKIVAAEAGNEDIIGQILVANVVLNRVKNEYFPDTIQGVVFENVNGAVQFQPVSDGRYNSVEISTTTVEAVERALAGEDYSQGALYFCASYVNTRDSWFNNSLSKLFVHGRHEFFTLKN